MLRNREASPAAEEEGTGGSPSKIFAGVGFVLLGFDSTQQAKVGTKLVSGGGIDVGESNTPSFTHLIVDKIVYDDSECVVARAQGKTVVTALWVEHSLDVGMLVDATSILYRPVKDLNGIPGAKSLSMCLTGYQRQDRDDIMRMVGLMGAYFSKPLVANKVTHLICYKFEGEKYELAKKLKKIKLVNHRWLEDCLRAWKVLPECNYNKSGYELEIMEAEAKDSEEETEDRNNKLFGESVAGSPSNLHSGSGVGISKGSEMPMPMIQKEAAEIFFPDRTEDNINEKRFVTSPRKDAGSDFAPELYEVNRNRAERAGRVTVTYDRGILRKQSSELTSNPVTATLESNAATPSDPSYSRKSPGRSPVSKFSGLPSSRVHGSPHGVSEQHKVNDGFDVSQPKLDQCKSNLDFGQNLSLRNGSKMHVEGGNNPKLPRRKKISLSGADSRSPRKVSPDSKACTTRSPPASGKTEGSLIGRPQIKSSLCPGTGDKYLKKSDVGSIANNQPAKPNIKSLDIDNKSFNHGVPVSRTTLTADTEFPSGFKMLQRTLEKSGLGLEKSKSSTEGNNGDNEMYKLTEFQFDAKDDPGEDRQTIMISSLTSRSETDRSKSPMDLDADNGSKNETFAKPLPRKKLAKKSLGSKSKLSSGSTKQKGSLCLKKKDILDAAIVSTEEGKEADHGKTVGLNTDMGGPVFEAEAVLKKKATEDSCSEKKIKNAVAGEDDETEAPDEDTGAELMNAATEEMSKRIPRATVSIEEKLEVAQNPIIEMEREMSHPENATMISEKDEEEVAKGDKRKSEEVGGSISKEEMVKWRNPVSRKSKESGVSVKKKTEKCEKDKEKTIDDEMMQAKKGNGGQHSGSECKIRPVSVEKDDKVVENGDVMEGRKYVSSKGKKNARADVEKSKIGGKGKKAKIEKETSGGDRKVDVVKGKAVEEAASRIICAKKEEAEKENKASGSKLNRVRPETAWFILSGHRLQRKELQVIIKRLRGRVCRDSHNWSYQATHFIVPDPIRRTEKFFAAAASGRWILKTDYVSASNQAGKLLPEEPHEWFKNGFSEDGAINLEAPRKWRLLRERTGHGAFYGMRIIIYGECIAPSLDTLKRAVKGGDGIIVATSPPYTRFLKSGGVDFAVVSPGMGCVDSWVQEFLRHEIPCVAVDYLVEYVCKPGCSLERHVLFKTHDWADNSFANLLKMSQEIVDDDDDDDIPCRVCGRRDREEAMLICGDESASLGCGVGAHLDCCEPPLQAIPDEDWFCPNCTKTTHPKNKTKKRPNSSAKRRS